jgi:hypothetical protein
LGRWVCLAATSRGEIRWYLASKIWLIYHVYAKEENKKKKKKKKKKDLAYN